MNPNDQNGRLMLKRKINETIIVQTPSGSFEITVVGVMSGVTQLCFECPKHIRVFRKEAYERQMDERDGNN